MEGLEGPKQSWSICFFCNIFERVKLLHGCCGRLLECLDLEVRRVYKGAFVRILEGLICIDVLVRGSKRTLEGLGGNWSIWKGPVVVGRSWRVFRDPGGLRLVQKDAGGYR